jgi:hypothetical protein
MKLSLSKNNKKATHHQDELGDLQILNSKLAHNALAEFKLGFDENEIRSKREVQKLIKIIEDQYLHTLAIDKFSCLESIRIGWRLPRYALQPILQQVIPLLLQKPVKVQHLQLILDAWIPQSTLKRLVSWHTLETLDLRSTRVRTRALSDPRHNRGSVEHCDSFIVEDNILVIVPYISQSVKTLKLVDCDLRTYHIPQLAKLLRKRRKLRSLSLRHNRELDIDGSWDDLMSMPCLESLDISICDLDPADGFHFAAALANNKNQSLQRLSVAGNYRMSTSIPKLIQVACTRLVELDCSFCDVNNKIQKQVFELLATQPNCTLRSLKIQGIRVNNADALAECIRHNTSLERLILDHPREPFPVDLSVFERLSKALQYNYYLQILRLDTMAPQYLAPQDRQAIQQMQFWLQLNRCGRSLLLQDGGPPTLKSWPTVLAQAASLGDINVLFWLLKNGAEQF